MPSTVYLLTNPAMPNLVKIGFTAEGDASTRIAQLFSTGVPVPFEIVYSCQVADEASAIRIESALHAAFQPYRINPRREFFRIEPEQAIAIMSLFQIQDTTQQLSADAQRRPEVDPDSLAAGEQMRRRRPNMNFEAMGIPVGSVLHFTRGEATVTVVGPKRVRLGDEEMFISAATEQVSADDAQINPSYCWTFNGRLLRDIYNETYDFLN